MRKILIVTLIVFCFSILFADNFLTIYNDNQALYKTNFELDLKKGIHFYAFENIPTQIVTESVIFESKDNNVMLFSQNYEYDFASSAKMIRKYIGKSVRLITSNNELYEGLLMFYDSSNYGLLTESTNEFNMISTPKVQNIYLSEMPTDFYIKPTLRWEISAQNDGTYPVELAYLTSGLQWRATYNITLNKNDLDLNSWVTINNYSGKDFEDIKLKLIAGSVQTYTSSIKRSKQSFRVVANEENLDAAPTFEEKEFSDYRLYTLDQKADIDNNQEKQLALYPTKTATYKRIYQYRVSQSEVDVLISFKNSKEDGLGVPLPKGNVNFYEIDESDHTAQFVGVNSINHTSINEEIKLKIGTAFDLVPKTTVVSSERFGSVTETIYEVKISNNKSDAATVVVYAGARYRNYEIMNASILVNKIDAFTYSFDVNLAPSETKTFTFTERITH
ncbi:MAG: hypothetical protein M0Q94_06870 [Candidatus Cloacimonetes bacterium]|nr:hypothetical protein [Candidatus Cloacimonadota bacterium]